MVGEPPGNLQLPTTTSTESWWLRTVVVRITYWVAILLPVIYIPLLLTRLHTLDELFLFLALFGLHVVALIGGRTHRREANP